MKDLIFIGFGGHAEVISDIAERLGRHILGYLDDAGDGRSRDYPYLGKTDDAEQFADTCEFVICIGCNEVRRAYAERHPLPYAVLVHPSAVIGKRAQLGAGTVVMANAVVNANAKIGAHCIINSAAVVEHDNCLGNFVHISPHGTLSGIVSVGDGTHVCTGATIINNITVCENCIIGAGATVISDITESGTYVGVPARRIK